VRLSSDKLKELGRARGVSLKELLDQSGVSKTAYYHLLSKDSVLPRSIGTLAETLGAKASSFLIEESEEDAIRRIGRLTEAIAARHPNLDRDNIRHTLLLLEEEPLDRLHRGLTRGRKIHLH
jgi:transcriptional regulator with XRE-family HTH domain